MNDDDLLKQFVDEAREHLAAIEKQLLRLEEDPENLEIIHAIFHGVHGIKGTSDYTDLKSINSLSHELETILTWLRQSELRADAAVIDGILKGVDLIKECVDHVDEPNYKREEIARFAFTLRQATEAHKDAPAPKPQPVPPLDFMAVFLSSAWQHIEVLELCARKAKVNATPAILNQLRRTVEIFHNSANYLGLDVFSTILAPLTADLRQAEQITPENLAGLEATITALREKTKQTQNSEAAKIVEKRDQAVEKVAEDELGKGRRHYVDLDTIRVGMGKLDILMNLVSELVVVKNSVAHLAATINERAIEEAASKQLKSSALTLGKITDQLQHQIMSVRLIPVSSVFDHCWRIVRDITKRGDKKATFQSSGDDTEIDKSIAEMLHEPLMHLVRNCLAHGIETPAERVAAGKAESGIIQIGARRDGNFICIKVNDDGRGLDLEKIRAHAIELQIIDSSKPLTRGEIINLIFQPGLSTADITDSLSGRGVGLDVVASNVKKIGGNIFVDFDPGKGTQFELKIPLTLAIIEAFIIQAGDARYALPSAFIEETISVNPERISKLNNLSTIIYRNDPVPLLELCRVLGVAAFSQGNGYLKVIILNITGIKVGLVVDRILRKQDILIKPLTSFLAKLRHYSGAAVMSDGSLILILNPPELIS